MAPIDRFIDQFLTETWDRSPTIASAMGVDGYDDELDDLSEDSIRERYERAGHWLSEFGGLLDDGLSLDEQIDRDLAISYLKGIKIMEEWQGYKRDPGFYLGPGLQGVHILFLHRLRPEKDLAVSAASRLRKIPALLESAKKNLDTKLAVPLFAERALGMCRAGIAYFRNMLPAEIADEKSKRLVAEAGEVAASAYEDYATLIEKLKTDGEGDWAIGEELYDRLLVEKEMLGYGARDMRERGRAAFDELDREMAGHTEKWRGTRDWQAVRKELQDQSPFEHPDEVRDEFEKWTELSRQFLIDRDLVTLPEGEECKVVPSPSFVRPILAVASYSAPPAFKPTRRGHFFVPYPPEGTPEEEVRQRAKGNGALGIPTTAVHEAYPGHHWHLVKMKDNPRPIRKVIRTSYFTEGWALYAEKMMREEGFFEDPAHELGQLGARIFRAARIIVDTSLHLGEMTREKAVEFILGNLGGAEPTIRTEVERYCSWPTQAPSYLTGAMEIDRMRDRWFAEKKGTLKEFHDTIATSGGLPIGLAERALFG